MHFLIYRFHSYSCAFILLFITTQCTGQQHLISTADIDSHSSSPNTQSFQFLKQLNTLALQSPQQSTALEFASEIALLDTPILLAETNTTTTISKGKHLPPLANSHILQLKMFASFSAAAYCFGPSVFPKWKCGYPRCSNPEISLSTLTSHPRSHYPNSYFHAELISNQLENIDMYADVLDATLPHFYIDAPKSHMVGFVATNHLLDHLSFLNSSSFSPYSPYSGKKSSIIIAFRGSLHPVNFVRDLQITLADYDYPGGPANSRIHSGFWRVWSDVRFQVLNALQAVIHSKMSSSSSSEYVHFDIWITGHSLGGSVAALCGLELRRLAMNGNLATLGKLIDENSGFIDGIWKFEKASLSFRVYTFGQPRTGNTIFSNWLTNLRGFPVFRTTYYSDLVVHLPPRKIPVFRYPLQFSHHAAEYFIKDGGKETVMCDIKWISSSTSSNGDVFHGEDPDCSRGVQNLNILSHLHYWDVIFGPWC